MLLREYYKGLRLVFPNFFLLRNWLNSSIFKVSRQAPELFPQPPTTAVPVEHENDVSNKRAPAFETFAPSGRGSSFQLLQALKIIVSRQHLISHQHLKYNAGMIG